MHEAKKKQTVINILMHEADSLNKPIFSLVLTEFRSWELTTPLRNRHVEITN